MKRKLGILGMATVLLSLVGCLAMEPEPRYSRPIYNNYWAAPHTHWDRDDWHHEHRDSDHNRWQHGHWDRH